MGQFEFELYVSAFEQKRISFERKEFKWMQSRRAHAGYTFNDTVVITKVLNEKLLKCIELSYFVCVYIEITT